ATPSNERVMVDGRRVSIQSGTADEHYFETLRIPMIAGREFTTVDTPDAPRVAVVNEAFVKAAWTDGIAVGRTFKRDNVPVMIVGVVRNVKHSSLDAPDSSFAYYPMTQQWQANQTLFVRGAGVGPQTADAIRAAVKSIDVQVPAPAITSLAEETSYAL